MGAAPLIGLLELDSGASLLKSLGPTGMARLARTCPSLASALPGGALPYGSLREVCAQSPAYDDTVPEKVLLNAPALFHAVGSTQPTLVPELPLLRAICGVCEPRVEPIKAVAWLDELCRLLANGTPPGSSAMWARALRKPSLSVLLQGGTEAAVHEEPPDREALTEKLFNAINQGSAAGVLLALAAGADPMADGAKILGHHDHGCCRWSPLAAAADAASTRKSAPAIASMLLAAQADVNARCAGTCGWTALMFGARQGEAGAEICSLLVHAGADVRVRHGTSGATALDMAKPGVAQCIRDARHKLNQEQESKQKELDRKQTRLSQRKGGRNAPKMNAALAYAGTRSQGRSGKGR